MLLPGIRSTSAHPARSVAFWIQRITAGSSPTWPSTQPIPLAPYHRPMRNRTTAAASTLRKPTTE